MKNIDFTDFFNVFLSGATIRHVLFLITANSETLYPDDPAFLTGLLVRGIAFAVA